MPRDPKPDPMKINLRYANELLPIVMDHRVSRKEKDDEYKGSR
jgi:hypothetical protein